MCDIKGCKNKDSYGYNWKQGKGKFKIELCIYCHYQLLGEMLRQLMWEQMADRSYRDKEDDPC